MSLAVIVPSRGRPESILHLLDSFDETSAHAALVVVCDKDDPLLVYYHELQQHPLWASHYQFKVYDRVSKGVCKPLNQAASVLKYHFDYLGFMGDDQRPRTPMWDQYMIDVLKQVGTGIVYGNDLFQGELLPTSAIMTADIVQALDGMVPPNLTHLYADDFWKRLGLDLGSLHYLPEVIIEHLHPIAGKADWDEGYREVNDPALYRQDLEAFQAFVNSSDYRLLLQRLSPNVR